MAGRTEWDPKVVRALFGVAQFDNDSGDFVVCIPCKKVGNDNHLVKMRSAFQIHSFARHCENGHHNRR